MSLHSFLHLRGPRTVIRPLAGANECSSTAACTQKVKAGRTFPLTLSHKHILWQLLPWVLPCPLSLLPVHLDSPSETWVLVGQSPFCRPTIPSSFTEQIARNVDQKEVCSLNSRNSRRAPNSYYPTHWTADLPVDVSAVLAHQNQLEALLAEVVGAGEEQHRGCEQLHAHGTRQHRAQCLHGGCRLSRPPTLSGF